MAWLSGTILDANEYMNTVIGQGMDYASILSDLSARIIGRNIYYRNIPNKDMALIKNPYKRRYDYKDTHDKIGEKTNIYEKRGRQIVFLDDVNGVWGYTHEDGYKTNENIKVLNNLNTVISNSNRKKYNIKNQYRGTDSVIQSNHFNYDRRKETVSKSSSLIKEHVPTNAIIFDINNPQENIISNTIKLYRDNKIKSIVREFYSENENNEFTQTSISRFGLSRGRNLLKTNDGKVEKVNGYDNPYCRVWTAHHQYGKYKDTIRPFENTDSFKELHKNYGKLRTKNAAERLDNNSVLDVKTNTVRIAPTNKDEIKRCMFSIENLAWKGYNGLTPKQTGPCNGRIMWFPPYGLNFTENVNANWNSQSFIGRGEKIYTYIDTDRKGTLDFILLVDHPSVINQWRKSLGNNIENEDDKENHILRFFAGCGNLEYGKIRQENKNTENSKEETSIENGYKNSNELTYIVPLFFPNNYSLNDLDNKSESEFRKEIERIVNSYEKTGEGKVEPPIKYVYDKDMISTDDMIEVNYSYGLHTVNGVEKYSNIIKKAYNISNNYTLISMDGFIKNLNEKFSVNKIEKLLEKNNINIEIIGVASSHGTIENNKKLSSRRKETFTKYLKSILDYDIKYEEGKTMIYQVDDKDIKNQNGFSAKIGRCSIALFKVTPKNNDEINDNIETQRVKLRGENDDNGTINSERERNEYSINSKNEDDSVDYYNEYDYFQAISKEDHLLYTKIIDKIKYFNPAYHSITPEGFNARLTFLHQCTRQGPTNSASENNKSKYGAGNLSFGMAPYCILRIGDFYNTKICIDTLSISYETGQWDLNPEGIGVQPMLAKITLNFTFIGGSDLEGPINRLQNAVSANYYANTSIYDKTSNTNIDKNNKENI